MNIEIPDDWLKDNISVPRDTPIEEAIELFMRADINRKYFIFALGEYALHQICIGVEK